MDSSYNAHPGHLALDAYRRASGEPEGITSYRGLPIYAWPGVHDAVCDEALRTFPSGSEILDVASGSGALCLRLRDAGFCVTASDIVRENFRLLDAVPFVTANFNLPFASKFNRTFDGIIAVEVLEHLENPRHFIRELFSLLRPGGSLILTTPNIDSAMARAILIRSGEFMWFDDQAYVSAGHITPIPIWVLKKALSEAGFRLVNLTSIVRRQGSAFSWWRMHALVWVLRMLDVAKTPQGYIVLAVARRS